MKKLILLALAFLAIAAPELAVAQAFLPGKSVQDTNPEPHKDMCWSGSAFAPCFSAGQSPPSAPQSYTLLSNATASGAAVTGIAGGGYIYDLSGTFGGTSAALQVTDSSGIYQTQSTCTAACTIGINIGFNSSARVVLTGGSPTAMNAKLGGIGGPIANITTPVTVLSASTTPATWTTGTTAQDARNYASVTLQISGLSGGDSITVTGSLDSANYVTLGWVDQIFNTGSSITASGIYSFPGGRYLKWIKTGSSSTPTLTIRAGN